MYIAKIPSVPKAYLAVCLTFIYLEEIELYGFVQQLKNEAK